MKVNRVHFPPWTLPVVTVIASTGVMSWSLWRALDIESPLPSLSGVGESDTPKILPRRAVAGGASATDADPFRPDRSRPLERFRLPGEALAQTSTQAATSPVDLTLIGTAVLPEGRGFAMCQLAGESPKLVRIGGRIGAYVLRTVDQGRAVFVSTDGRLTELRVPKAGS